MRKMEPIILTEKQERWLEKHFKHTKNAEIATKLGISLRSVSRIARRRGLEKSSQFMEKAQRNAANAANISHIIHGTYPPKGFRVPGSEKHQFKKGESPLDRIGPKRERERIMKSTATREETRRKEKRRVLFGLPQKTKLRVVRQPREKVLLRYALKSHGYVVDNIQRIAYWNAATRRSKALETKEQPWFKIQEANATT